MDAVVLGRSRVHLDLEIALQGVDVDSDVGETRLLRGFVDADFLRVVLGVIAERVPLAPIGVLERLEVGGVATDVVCQPGRKRRAVPGDAGGDLRGLTGVISS